MLLKRVLCAHVCYARFVKSGTDIKALGRIYRETHEGNIVETSKFSVNFGHIRKKFSGRKKGVSYQTGEKITGKVKM